MEEFLPAMFGDRVNEISKKTVPLYIAEGLLLDKQKIKADVATMIAEVVHKERKNLRAEITLQVNNAIANCPLQIKFDKLAPSTTPCRPTAIRPKDHDDHQDDAYPEGENSTKRQKTSEHGTYTVGESSLEQYMGQEPNPSDLDDDEVPAEEVSPELMEETSEEIDEAQLKKVVDDMMRQRCNSGEEHHHHIDQIFSLSKLPKRSKSSTNDSAKPRPVLLEVSKCRRKFNVYAQYGVEHWKNMWAKTSYELGHENKFITELIVRRANEKIDLITEPDYKYLNKNDIKDLYLLCINGKVDNYRETRHGELPVEIGMIYENSKKEKRVMIHKEIYKFCDATIKRVLEKLNKYNKDVKYGYVDPSPSYADAE
ncbi:hypothetical protein Tco_0881663 [Tanacetum coccineum]